MRWKESSDHKTAYLLDDAVNWLRNRGLRRYDAVEQAALKLGLSPRKARSILNGEAYSIGTEEYERIKALFREHVADQIAHHEREAEKLRTRIAQMRLGDL